MLTRFSCVLLRFGYTPFIIYGIVAHIYLKRISFALWCVTWMVLTYDLHTRELIMCIWDSVMYKSYGSQYKLLYQYARLRARLEFENSSGPFCCHGLTLVIAWISNRLEISSLEWISDMIAHFTVHVIICPYLDWCLTILVEGAPISNCKITLFSVRNW